MVAGAPCAYLVRACDTSLQGLGNRLEVLVEPPQDGVVVTVGASAESECDEPYDEREGERQDRDDRDCQHLERREVDHAFIVRGARRQP
jgi:hypothetical protein